AAMALRACEIDILRPGAKTKLAYPENLRINVVSAREETPDVAEKDRISWTLLTSLPIDSVENAMKILDIYKLRWKIERFHYVLKSGCNVEKKQLKTVHSLKNMLAFFSIVAYKLLWLKYEAQTNPEQSCEAVLSKTEWQALCCRDGKTAVPPQNPPSLAKAAVMIAKLGGFIARKNDGFPGVKAIWDGLKRLHDTHETFLVIMKEMGGNNCG
ncbi:MAG: IS4 family transposase, partial [Fibromonadaceae bacterium]|nr:IS4 family transposase [Fibromonadaceae bacterium]